MTEVAIKLHAVNCSVMLLFLFWHNWLLYSQHATSDIVCSWFCQTIPAAQSQCDVAYMAGSACLAWHVWYCMTDAADVAFLTLHDCTACLILLDVACLMLQAQECGSTVTNSTPGASSHRDVPADIAAIQQLSSCKCMSLS